MADGTGRTLPLVFLPGMDGARKLREPLLAQLQAQRPVLFLEYPDREPLSYQELANRLMAALPDGNFILLGESFGGPLAIEIATRLPQRVSGLILAATFVTPPMPEAFSHLMPWFSLSMIPHAAIEWIMLGSTEAPAVRAELYKVLTTLDHAVLQKRATEAMTTRHADRLRQVRMPVLCLAGRHDHLLGQACIDTIREAQPEAQVVLLDAPHMVLETHPVDAATHIERFCAAILAE